MKSIGLEVTVVARNDITGDSIVSRSSENYKNNFDKVFGKKKDVPCQNHDAYEETEEPSSGKVKLVEKLSKITVKNYTNKMREAQIMRETYPLRFGQILCTVFETSNSDLWFEEDPIEAKRILDSMYDIENDCIMEDNEKPSK